MRPFFQRATGVLLACFLCGGLAHSQEIPPDPKPQWWKGNLHTHTLWSDGDDFPEMVIDWYRQRGDYHFLALSDHNVLSQGQRWIPDSVLTARFGPEVLEKYVARFGRSWVETRSEPAEAVRLKPFSEYRSLFEEQGRFLMIASEEITSGLDTLPIHINATNIQELIEPESGTTVTEVIEANLRAVNEQAARLGREIIAHVNHPNFGWGITAEQLAHATSEEFFEVFNGHPGVNQLGDDTRPSVDGSWDIANTIRLGVLDAPMLMGIGTDDSHNYHGGPVSTGRGWIMVRSTHLTPESLIRAMRRGDFYASTGVSLHAVAFDPETETFSVQIDAEEGVTYETEFVGSYSDAVTEGAVDPEKVGVVFARVSGRSPVYKLSGNELFVRAKILSSRAHPNPSFKGQVEEAWTQPVTGDR